MKVKSRESQIEKIIDNIVAINERSHEIWFGRTKFSVKHEDRLREKIRPLDLLRERLFIQLFSIHLDTDFDYTNDWEELSVTKVFNGQKYVTRITYCDGVLHYVTNKNVDRLVYGYHCTCA